MKIPNFVKVGGTTIAALILSACGSSGGDDSPSVKSSANTTPTTPVVPAPTAKEDQSVKAFNAAKAAEQAQESAVAANADAAKKEDLASAKDALKQIQAAQAAANSAAQAAAAAAAKAKAENAENAGVAADYAKRAADAVKALDIIAAGTQELVAKRMKQDDANKSIAVTSTPSNKGSSHVGYHHTQKVQSDLILDGKAKPANNESNTAVVMPEQNIHPERDTFVAANTKVGDTKYSLYLQDMDLRKADKVGKITDNMLTNHKVNVDEALLELVANNRNAPDFETRIKAEEELVLETKTTERGVTGKKSEALVYTENSPFYIDINSGLKQNTPVIRLKPANSSGTRELEVVPFATVALTRDGTSLEVYGANTTFTKKGPDGSPEVHKADEGKGDIQAPSHDAKNLPLMDEVSVLDGVSLQYVQYGRVTSQISGRELDAFLNGLDKNVKIAPYGFYGQPGTENHYFARGTNNTTANQLAAMPKVYGTSKMTYDGHAVAYGLDNEYTSSKPMRVPNALGGTVQPHLISGNHFHADVDLQTKEVQGSVYNNWVLAKNGYFPQATDEFVQARLVEFAGTLASNGNIAGTAVNLTKNNSEGIFNATLFGQNGEEMGGTIVSKEPEKVQWGLSFGAVNTTTPVGSPNVVSPNPKGPKNYWASDIQAAGGPAAGTSNTGTRGN